MLRTSQYLLLRSGSRGHDTMREHFTLPGTIICSNFSFTFVDLTLANVLDDRSTILRCKVPNFTVVSVFHACCQRLKYILLLLQFEIFSAFTPQGIASSRLLPIIYWSDEFLNRASIFKHRLDIREEHFRNHMLYAHCTPQNSRSTYSIIFALLQCSHLRSCIRCEQHSCCLFQATASTQLHPHFVILAPLH